MKPGPNQVHYRPPRQQEAVGCVQAALQAQQAMPLQTVRPFGKSGVFLGVPVEHHETLARAWLAGEGCHRSLIETRDEIAG